MELAEQIAEAFDMKERCEEAERLRQEKETALREKKQEFGALQVRYEKAEKEAEASIHDYENAERRYRHGIAGHTGTGSEGRRALPGLRSPCHIPADRKENRVCQRKKN